MIKNEYTKLIWDRFMLFKRMSDLLIKTVPSGWI